MTTAGAQVLTWDEALRVSHEAVMPCEEDAFVEAEMVVLMSGVGLQDVADDGGSHGRALAGVRGVSSPTGEQARRLNVGSVPPTCCVIRAGWRIEMKYAAADNYAGRAIYNAAVAVLREPVAQALLHVQESLEKQGFSLVVWDAYRPWRITWMMWHTAPPEMRRRFVADPSRGSVHNRGGAVDVGLMSLRTGELLEMPSGFDEFNERSACDYMGGTVEQRTNRDTLIDAMHAQGFDVDRCEWWHFNYRDGRRYRLCNEPLSSFVKASG